MKSFSSWLFLGFLAFMSPSCAQDHDEVIQEIYVDSLKQSEQGKKEAIKLLDAIDPKQVKPADDSLLGMSGQKSKNQTGKIDSVKPCEERVCKAKVINIQQSVQQNAPSALLVFVTLSMTDESLRSLSREVNKVGGRMIIRGLINDSFQQTQKRLLDLKINLDIDPPLFEQFDVREVPAFVHVKVEQGEYSKLYDVLKGNVTLAYAVERFSEHGTINTQHLLNQLGSKQLCPVQLRGCS